jgi:protein-S-isoprenylcysteine O-methyltransferase Ste14
MKPVDERWHIAALILRALLFTLIAPASVTIWIPLFLLEVKVAPIGLETGGYRLVGIPLILAGVAGYAWCAWDFVSAGRGTPAPWDAPRRFVARGLYRFMRNPMYVSVSLVLMGESALSASLKLLVYSVLVLGLFHLFVIAYEEPALRQQFGREYEAYFERVPRWLLRRRR